MRQNIDKISFGIKINDSNNFRDYFSDIDDLDYPTNKVLISKNSSYLSVLRLSGLFDEKNNPTKKRVSLGLVADSYLGTNGIFFIPETEFGIHDKDIPFIVCSKLINLVNNYRTLDEMHYERSTKNSECISCWSSRNLRYEVLIDSPEMLEETFRQEYGQMVVVIK